MPAFTPENEAYYGPWPPMPACRVKGHNWGGQPETDDPYPVTPFPAEGQRQTCPVCGCARETDEFGRLHYLVPREFLEADARRIDR